MPLTVANRQRVEREALLARNRRRGIGVEPAAQQDNCRPSCLWRFGAAGTAPRIPAYTASWIPAYATSRILACTASWIPAYAASRILACTATL
jgi:hypothetical protein